MKKRLFIGTPPDEKSLQRIQVLVEKLKPETIKLFRWLPKENWHFTWLFLGYLEDGYLPTLEQIIKNLTFTQIQTTILKVDYGPPQKPRMIWLYLAVHPEMVYLMEELEKEIIKEKIPFEKEKRKFLPHITLARLEKKENKKSLNLPFIKEELDWPFNIEKIIIYQSILKKSGAEYLPLYVKNL